VIAIMRPLSGALPDRDRTVLGAFALAAGLLAVLLPLAAHGAMSPAMGAATGVGLTSILAGVGVLVTLSAVARTGGVEAKVWGLFAKGLASWALGCVPYFVFLATGGDFTDPQAWSQIGFLAAYPFWYRALWLMRQPALDDSRRRHVEGFAIELSVLAMLFVIVVAALWEGSLSAVENIALQVPVALDLLLLAALYNAVRRSTVTHRTAFVWFAYAFVALALTDAAVTYLVTRDAGIGPTGLAMFGYMIAMALVGIAARRPIRVTEAQAVLGPSKTIIAAIGLGLSGPATVLAATALRPVVWVLAVFLVWRLAAQVRIHGQSETDPLSGFLEGRAFARHVGGVVQAASSTRPAMLIAVDLDGFGRWNAQHGYGAGDALLTDLAARLEGSSLAGGVWSRLGADRFAWIGIGHEGMDGRLMAETVHDIAAANTGGLPARAAFVVLPDDAATAANAIAAAEEALAAAQAGDRRVVAFDRGRLDGLEYTSGYSASLAQRRDAILELLQEPETISTVFQPIVSLADGATLGYESLSRFRAEPARPPDKWIAEAHAVGLGLEIEVECVRRALALRSTIPGDAYLSVNMSPDAILTPEMEAALGDGVLDGLVIEITEHDAVGDYARLAARLADLRGRGARVAIDDAGAGHASMRHVTQLSPDYIKIDRSLIHDIHVDHAKRALVRSMVSLEEDLGARVVAEGIERTEELRTLRELGVPLGQGYLLARPHRDPSPAPWSAALLLLAEPTGGRET
jgi:EAL domain-containing protein (putative c-di-GMP-specific phosphodiesterase class I)/GGDEF domain-containing protein